MEKENQTKMAEQPQSEVYELGTKNSVKDIKENAIREESEKMKLKYSAKVNVLIEDKNLREKLHEVISEAVDEAMLTGRIAGVPEDMMKSATDAFANVAKGFGCLNDACRAETYKKLFHNQRIITSQLMSIAQILQLQIGDTESLVIANPFSLFGTMGNTLVPNPPDFNAK